MMITVMLMMLVIIVLLFLYVPLKRDVKELKKQLVYRNQQKSLFTFYTSSYDQDMHAITEALNTFRKEQMEQCHQYQRKDEDFKDMITSISHDIRTPLTSIQGYIQLLKECDNQEDADRYHAIIKQRLDYMKELLEELFLYTKIVNQSINYVMEPICLYDIVCETLLNYYPQLKEKGIEASVMFEDEQTMIESDAVYIRRILNNLSQNVVQHGVGSLHITQREVGKQVLLCFSNQMDYGIINTEALFQRFYTGDQARSTQNSGLGLTIVKELAEALGGNVEAKAKDKQLDILLYLPSKGEVV